VARYLSDEWLAALDRAIASTPGGVDLVVELRVTGTGTGDGARTYHVDWRGERPHVVAGSADHPTVTLTQDYATAVAIARGQWSAQEAFMDGEVRIGGDLRALVSHADMLGGLDDVFGAVRESTTW